MRNHTDGTVVELSSRRAIDPWSTSDRVVHFSMDGATGTVHLHALRVQP